MGKNDEKISVWDRERMRKLCVGRKKGRSIDVFMIK
jgi:hypothetical protein